MVQLTLEPEKAELLARVLQNYLSDLRFEISNTEGRSYRDGLKEDERDIRAILDGLVNQGVRQK